MLSAEEDMELLARHSVRPFSAGDLDAFCSFVSPALQGNLLVFGGHPTLVKLSAVTTPVPREDERGDSEGT